MSTSYPTALDALANPAPTSLRNAPSLAGELSNANDAIEALQAKVGVDSSGVTTSLDYRTRALEVVGNDYRPEDVGLVAWNYDPAVSSNSSAATNGTLFLGQINVRHAVTITNLVVTLIAAAVTPVAGQNFLGLYNAAGTLVASTASTVFDTPSISAGVKILAVSTPYAAAVGKYWVGILMNAATPATLLRAQGSVPAGNIGLAPAAYRFAANGTALTALPASIVPASNTTGGMTVWVAAS